MGNMAMRWYQHSTHGVMPMTSSMNTALPVAMIETNQAHMSGGEHRLMNAGPDCEMRKRAFLWCYAPMRSVGRTKRRQRPWELPETNGQASYSTAGWLASWQRFQ